MKNIFFFIFIAGILMPAAAARAGEDGIGLGVILGEPTGLSFKTWTGSRTAIDAAAAWSFSENASFQFHADYLVHPFSVPKPREVSGRVSFYYGIGGRFKSRESSGGPARNDRDDLFGIRFPLGFSFFPGRTQAELFAEIVPVLDIAPDTDADLNAAIGARYYFK